VTLAPTSVVTLGSKRYETHAEAVRVDLRALPGVNACAITLPAEAGVDAAPGDPAEVELDGGEGAETVLTGTVRAVHRGLRRTRVIAADGSADLAGLRPAATYERQDATAVIRALASDAGTGVERIQVTLQLAAYVAGQGRTAAEHVAALAELAGAIGVFTAGGKLDVAPAAPAAGMALRHGRELVACEVSEDPGPPSVPTPVGFGPAGSPQAPGALRHSDDAIPTSASAAGPGTLRRSVAVLHAPSVAGGAGQAASDLHGAEGSRLRGRAFLLPKLRPGTVLDVQDLPASLGGGPWLVTAVSHALAARAGGSTTFEARAASGGAGGLLGAGLSAVGGLL